MAEIKLNQLAMLVAVAESGSFSAASVELDCTQSRISHAIAELERRVGASLLVRSRTGCVPTTEGVRVLAKARQLLRVAESIVVESRQGLKRGDHVRIASVRSVGTHLLPYVAEALANESPALAVEIFDGCGGYDEVAAMVERGEADLGVTRIGTHPGFLSFPYVHDSYVIVVPSSTDISTPTRWDDLTQLPMVQVRHGGGEWIFEQLRRQGFHRTPTRWLANESSAITMVARGLGFTVLPRLATLPDMEGTRLVFLPEPLIRHLSIIVRPSIAEQDCVKEVVRLMREPQVIMRSHAWRLGALGLDGAQVSSTFPR